MWPQPSAAAAIEHYDGALDGMPPHLRQWRANTSQWKWYAHLADRLRKISGAGGRDVSSVVDVGRGGLELTASLARSFPTAHVEAWDLDAAGSHTGIEAALADRISFRQVDLNRLDTAFEGVKSFDIVACVAVIEHVLHPGGLLRGLHSITRPGGFTYVVGPLVTSIAHRLMGEAWPYYCPDEHLTLPSFLSIEKALARTGGGTYRLRCINVRYSLKYLMRFLHIAVPVPTVLDVVLPVPAGAFELVWWRPPASHGSTGAM